jgi:hypothetical protein
MDGMNRQMRNADRPIGKPDFPLPQIYSLNRIAERPTKRRDSDREKRERAHFFVKEFDENGRPTYGFVITQEPADHESAN